MIIEVNENSFSKKVLSADKIVLVDFWAPWCGPCRMLSTVIEQLSGEYEDKIKICKVNTDQNMSLSAKFQITSVPSLVLFKNGVVIAKMIGSRPKNEIKKFIDAVL
jgi:thioredoxin 1